MANDIQPITGTTAKAAARLCNFPTREWELLPSHKDWLDKNVAPVIKEMSGPYVDLLAYASRRGKIKYNKDLSRKRAEAVKNHIRQYHSNVRFIMDDAFGAEKSEGDENNNDGYWRAVEVHVYAYKPPPRPKPVETGSTFSIRLVEGFSASGPAGTAVDQYNFQISDESNGQTAVFRYVGFGLTIPVKGLPFSISKSGPPSFVKSSVKLTVKDFEGDAQLFQDPGAAAGETSVGNLRLSIESKKIVQSGATLKPRIVEISAGWGIQTPSAITATKGELRLLVLAEGA